MVVVSAEAGAPTVQSQSEAQQSELERGVRADPLVQAVLARFPGAEIVGVRRRDEAAGDCRPSSRTTPMPSRTTDGCRATTMDRRRPARSERWPTSWA